jgi:integrase/recombinase XerD
MHVERVLSAVARRESWTVVDDYGPVAPIERYLAYLTDIERSPNTVKAYAHDLKDWFDFVGRRELDWRGVRLEDVGEFVAWLRRPPVVREGSVAMLPSVGHYCGESTINRKLGGECVLSARRPERGGPGRSAGPMAAGRATWIGLEALSAPHHQRSAACGARHSAEGPAQAATRAHRHRSSGDLGCLPAFAGPVPVRTAA